ncbi:MAG TPA: mannose-1-phosphate guanyltransferase [Parvularcula sp.]|nr:mannose-1-phosphate guanyltransferase [Parvularcula sp.]HBS32085.1 mannose-1-phosphate guanyltransferase [Parvularcula sp.]HBS34722.1 mannose-1-phosphate guanyltransferase [Parvularcula sp.]
MNSEPPIQPVIMSGGAGTRLWPMSRQARPKQFLPLTGERSLFQETALRLSGPRFLAPVVIAGAAHRAAVAGQLDAVGVAPAAIIIEPMARNTAAVAAVAGAWTGRAHGDGLVLLTPADHHVADAGAFRAAIVRGAAAASKGAIVTLGVRPATPETGFGYIETGASIADGVFEVAGFREKPDRATAERYLAGGRHFWNSGVFLFSPSAMDAELHAHAPAIRNSAAAALAAARESGGVLTLDPAIFADCPSESIDYAVMEKTRRAAVVAPVDAGWSDIGSWTALAPLVGETRVSALDCGANVIRTDGPFVAAIGVSDLIIVATGDAVLVAPKDRAQDVKRVIDDLKARGRTDLL